MLFTNARILLRRCNRQSPRSKMKNSADAHSIKRLYSLAIAREIPDSFADALSMHEAADDENDPLSMGCARLQHREYVQALRGILPVLTLPALPNHPDCCFVEDAVIAIGNRAVVTRMGHASRRAEVDSIKDVLQQQLGMDVSDMREISGSETATCDGGDVLYTGRHLFVGLSNRTNEEGAKVLEAVFGTSGHVDVVILPPLLNQGDQVLHLKSAMTHINEYALLAPEGHFGDALLAAMGAYERHYEVFRLPDMLSCNVVSCNGVVLCQDTTCDESRRVLEEAVLDNNMDLVFVDTSELAKKDAALTCCSVLLDI